MRSMTDEGEQIEFDLPSPACLRQAPSPASGRGTRFHLFPRHTMGHGVELCFFDGRQAIIAFDFAAGLNPVAAMGDTAAAAFDARRELLPDPAHAGSIAKMTTHVGAPDS